MAPGGPHSVLTPTTERGKRVWKRPGGDQVDRVQVAVRVRPLNSFDRNTNPVVRTDNDTAISFHGTSAAEPKHYTYDNVFEDSQECVYDCIGRPMLRDGFEGYNVCLFAYGQTGSGKTYSILGDPANNGEVGIIPRMCRDMFSVAQERLENDNTLTIKITMSYIEIYNEKVRDLLEQRKRGQQELTSLEIREAPDKRVYVEGLWRPTVTNADRIQRFLDFGNSQKQVSETKMNEKSSRSHTILQLQIRQTHNPSSAEKPDMESTITLVDLAGSERQSKTETEGRTFDESKNINRSLLMLGRALNSFSDGDLRHVPLRESKLTRMLSDCFGGNARTWMLACVSPSAFNSSESGSTLEYAQNAKAITNHARINSVQQRLEFQQMKEQNVQLRSLYEGEQEKYRRARSELEQLKARQKELNEQLDHYRETAGTVSQERERLKTCLDTARLEIDELTRTSTARSTARPSVGWEGDPTMYIGRAKVSLKNIIEQQGNYLTLPLTSSTPKTGGKLVVNIYPVDQHGASKLDQKNGGAAPRDLLGSRVDFVVHIIKATDLPPLYAQTVYCKYVYKWAERDSYKTQEFTNETDPEFDFKKRFAFSKMNDGLVKYFMSDNVITFEVIAQGDRKNFM